MPDPTIYVVCEGPTDKRVLEHLLNVKFRLFVQVKVAGGEDFPGRSGGQGGNVRAYLERETPGAVIAVSSQDRNFISLQKVDKGWQNEKSKTLLWRRHEIENYLLEPKVVAHAFTRLREADDAIVARRYRRLPTDEDAITELLRDAANDGLTDVLTETLNDMYEPDRVFADDDFARLAGRLRQLAESARS